MFCYGRPVTERRLRTLPRMVGDGRLLRMTLVRTGRRGASGLGRRAVEQGDAADEAGASDGASQLIPSVRRTELERGENIGMIARSQGGGRVDLT